MSAVEGAPIVPGSVPSSDGPALPDRLVPLVIGVTGHRDAAAEYHAILRRRFGETLEKYAATYQNTPLVVLSGMAAGADTLAAEEAMARGIPVIACLASPLEQFESDFSNDERIALRHLLSRCSRVDVVTDGSDRHAGFLAVRSYLNRYSHILVAFWDGLANPRPGGTADVVSARLTASHLTQEEALVAPVVPDVGPVVQIVTPRENTLVPADAGDVLELMPSSMLDPAQIRREFSAALQCLDNYNGDLRASCETISIPPSLAALRRCTADKAASLQEKTNFWLRILFCIGGFMAFLTVIAQETLRVVAVAAAFACYRFAAGRKYQNRYQDYRALSEALRVQLAWNSVGLYRESVDIAYLKMYQSELEWIRMAIRSANLIFSLDPRYREAVSKDEYRKWVESQTEWMRDAALGAQSAIDRLGRFGTVAAIIGGSLCGLALVEMWLPSFDHSAATASIVAHVHWLIDQGAIVLRRPIPPEGSDREIVQRLGIGAITLGFLVKALLSGYIERRHFSTNAKRYARIQILFADGLRRLNDIRDGKPGDAAVVIRELGRESLVEQSDWLLTQRDRPLILVQGG